MTPARTSQLQRPPSCCERRDILAASHLACPKCRRRFVKEVSASTHLLPAAAGRRQRLGVCREIGVTAHEALTSSSSRATLPRQWSNESRRRRCSSSWL